MTELDEEWALFQNQLSNNTLSDNLVLQEEHIKTDIPKCSDIYISTQTKIAYLSSTIELYDIFWKLNVMDYYKQEEGIIKKSIKINCETVEEAKLLDERIKSTKNIDVNILSKVNNPNARKVKFKDIRKIDVGLSKKDLISYRKKKKGAFYNCFAIILRVFYKGIFKEVHVKIFNTGKLEIPGIQFDELLTITLDKLITILKPLVGDSISYNKQDISTVLINSNFSCRFFIDRFKLYEILKTKYSISAAYDPCSYPGIQCKFHYNRYDNEHYGFKITNEKKSEEYESAWQHISFMIFRTGSVLIVGNCDSTVLNIIYTFLKKILRDEYANICIQNNTTIKKKTAKKIRKKTLLFSVE
tara:strand:- start:1176 stop:2246 length:1071 start_codon:yes stop_codon:yes gene_type:complete